MKPYYDDGQCVIFHGDCREVLPTLDVFDLLLTDPPYGLGVAMWDTNRKTAKRRWRLHHDQMGWDATPADAAALLPRARHAIIWGGHLFGLPVARGWLVWNKIIRNFTSGVCELAWTDLDIPIDAFDYSHGQLATEGKIHPTQKPLPLMIWCIRKADVPATILDPFMGSGTTLRAAKDCGCKAVGIEIEEKYCEVAAKRLEQGVFSFDAPEGQS